MAFYFVASNCPCHDFSNPWNSSFCFCRKMTVGELINILGKTRRLVLQNPKVAKNTLRAQFPELFSKHRPDSFLAQFLFGLRNPRFV